MVEKKITSSEELEVFLRSKTYDEYMMFVTSVGDAIKGYPITSDLKTSENVNSFTKYLNQLNSVIDECPPVPQPTRFGNKAFQHFVDKVSATCEADLKTFLPEELHQHISELKGYLVECFGNRTRIDYGTGHEQCFAILLLVLHKLGFFPSTDFRGLGLSVFPAYLRLVRRLQKDYLLEPAGSRGVWGLDDYHFLPFIWGAAQLLFQDSIQPGDVSNVAVVRDYAPQYLYLNAIQSILELKGASAPFEEVAPVLYDISGVATWRKVYDGLLKMYHGEVHRKLPVMQHVLFGESFQFNPSDSAWVIANELDHATFASRLWNVGPKSMGAQYAPSVPPTGGALGVAPWAPGGAGMPPMGGGPLGVMPSPMGMAPGGALGVGGAPMSSMPSVMGHPSAHSGGMMGVGMMGGMPGALGQRPGGNPLMGGAGVAAMVGASSAAGRRLLEERMLSEVRTPFGGFLRTETPQQWREFKKDKGLEAVPTVELSDVPVTQSGAQDETKKE